MAKYKVEYDLENDKVTKTLTFMGKEYSEVWTEENSCCQCGNTLINTMDNFCRSCGQAIDWSGAGSNS